MKIAFAKEILDLRGKPIRPAEGLAALERAINDGPDTRELSIAELRKLLSGDGEPLTLKSVAESSLMHMFADDQSLSRSAKSARFALATRIAGGADELSVDEAKMLKDCIAKYQPPLIMGRCFEIIEAVPKGEPFDAEATAAETHQEA